MVFILLFFSGNPLASFQFGKFSPSIGLLMTIYLLKSDWKFDSLFKKNINLIFSIIAVIVISQYIVLPVFSILPIGNLFIKIWMGGMIIHHLGKDFPYIFFRIISKLSFISVGCFVLINILNIDFPYIQIGQFIKSYFFYVTLPDEGLFRNNGMFWEPGAHAGILTCCIALNFNHLQKYWYSHSYDLIFIFIALLTTRSTTGYFTGFVILSFYFWNPRQVILSLSLIFFIFIIGLYIYETNDFLKQKFENQFFQTQEQKVGEFSNTRLGSFIFDWHYIKKHPLIGNGFELESRYSDHKYLFLGEKGDVIGSGNSLSNYLASMGILFVAGYFFLLWKSVSGLGKIFSILFVVVILLNLLGEQWFNFPLYLGLPFLRLYIPKRCAN